MSNQLIRAALHPYPEDLLLVSKVGAERDDQGGWVPVALEDQLAEMGISNATLDQVETAIQGTGIVCVQNPFSLLDRHDGDVLDRCRESEIAYVPFFPLGSAFPGLPKVTQDEVVRAVAQRVEATPAQVGLPGCWPTTSGSC